MFVDSCIIDNNIFLFFELSITLNVFDQQVNKVKEVITCSSLSSMRTQFFRKLRISFQLSVPSIQNHPLIVLLKME